MRTSTENLSLKPVTLHLFKFHSHIVQYFLSTRIQEKGYNPCYLRKALFKFILGLLIIAISFLQGCSFPVTVKNRAGEAPVTFIRPTWKTDATLGIYPFPSSDRYTLICYDAVVEQINLSGAFRNVIKNYSGRDGADIVLKIEINPEYKVDRGKNFFIQWPGFLIFTPHWHGLVYTLILHGKASIESHSGDLLNTVVTDEDYQVRYTSTGRAILTGFPVGWFLFGAASLLSNAYIAWDDTMRDEAYRKLERDFGIRFARKILDTLEKTPIPMHKQNQNNTLNKAP